MSERTLNFVIKIINDIMENLDLKAIYGIKRSSNYIRVLSYNRAKTIWFASWCIWRSGSRCYEQLLWGIFFSLEFLHEMLVIFNCADCDKADKSQFVYKKGSWTDFKTKQNDIEMRNFIILYSIFVGNMVRGDYEVWELLTSFTKIFEIISFPIIYLWWDIGS